MNVVGTEYTTVNGFSFLPVLLQVCSRELEDENVLPRYGHLDVRHHSLGDVHARPGAVAGPERQPGVSLNYSPHNSKDKGLTFTVIFFVCVCEFKK